MSSLRAAKVAAAFVLIVGCAAPRSPLADRAGGYEASPTPREAPAEQLLDGNDIPTNESAEGWTPLRGASLRVRRTSSYELDDRERFPPVKGQKPSCDAREMVTYRGLIVRYDAPVLVHPAFVERLLRFERLVRQVAIEVYGRAPRTLHHGGAYMCRTTVTGRRFSEHAFGNALDVEGFSFDPLDRAGAQKLKDRGIELDPGARRAFRVHVGETWRERGRGIDKQFFIVLLDKLRARQDMFRGIIGPPEPAHTTHLHLDAGPWAYDRFAMP